MVSITPDPQNPDRLALTATVTVYLDRLLTTVLSAEVETAIREQALADLKSNTAVRITIAKAATDKLLKMLDAGSTT